MQNYTCAIFVFVALAVLVSAVPAGKNSNNGGNGKAKASTHAKPKVTCGICNGLGDDCKPTQKNTTCDKCCKFTGVADDPSQVPPFIWPIMGPGAKESMAKNKGKKMTFRGCATQSLIEFATFEDAYADTGCTEFDSFFGFNDVKACLCNTDCTGQE